MARSADASSNHQPIPETSGGGTDSHGPTWNHGMVSEPDSTSAVADTAANQSPSSSLLSLPLTASASEKTPFPDCSASKPAPTHSPPSSNNSSSGSASENPNGTGIGFRMKKPAWNKPSNGVVVASSEGGSSAVMGGPDSWPALSESARASPKPSGSSDSLSSSWSKLPLADRSISDSQGPVKISSPRKQASTNNTNPNSYQNHPMLARRTVRRNCGGPPSAHNNYVQPSPPPPLPLPQTPPMQPSPSLYPIFPVPPANAYGSAIPIPPDYSPRDPSFRRGVVAQPHLMNDHRNSQRRGNFGHHQQGEGVYHHNNYGGRRDHDRGNYGNPLDAHLQPQRGPHPPRGYPRQPLPSSPAYIASSLRFPPPVGFTVPEFVFLQPYDSTIRPAPYMPPSPPPILNPALDTNLPALIVNQIDYYFSDGNLITDGYLKLWMDDQGWVPISVVARFPRVQKLTLDIQLILNSLRASSAVEVQDDKIRKRNNWMNFLPTSGQVSPQSGSNSDLNLLASSIQHITLDEAATPSCQHSITSNANGEPVSEDGPENCSTESQLANGE